MAADDDDSCHAPDVTGAEGPASRALDARRPAGRALAIALRGYAALAIAPILIVATRFARLRRARDRADPDCGDPLRPATPRSRSRRS
ncbi:hypothetical protein A9X02_04960 [Mycobacterium malmoense]|nr:hypothetical protein A9X02_04960 [Mycobacterium malmoense]